MTDNANYRDREMYEDDYAAASAVHDYHDALPGFSQDQIWHDGCTVCEARGRLVAIHQLDSYNFRRAWWRAHVWETGGLKDMARCERRLFETLNACRHKGLTLL